MSTHFAIGFEEKDKGKLGLLQLPTPEKVEEGHVLIKNEWLGMTPLTQWQVDFGLVFSWPFIASGNTVGRVVKVGENVREELKPGVAVFTFVNGANEGSPGQEYVVAPQNRVGVIPEGLSPQEAATVPDNFTTAWHSFANDLEVALPTENLDNPSTPEDPNIPILIWGGGTSVGHYAIQILKWAGYKNVIVTASSRHHEALRKLGATHTIDYNSANVTEEIFKLTGEKGPRRVLDCVGDEENTVLPISKVVTDGAIVALLLPIRYGGYGKTTKVELQSQTKFPEGVKVIGVRTHFYDQKPGAIRDKLQPHIMPYLLKKGYVTPNKTRVVEGKNPLERFESALNLIRNAQVSGEKLVISMQP